MGSKVESMRYHNERMIEGSEQVNAVDGQIHWSAVKSLWIALMTVGGILGGVVFFSWDALLLFVLASGITLCAGHSVGMHRKLIHRSFDCPGWLEKTLVYLGTLVGLGGPFTMMRMHDMRDWAQRQNACHDYFGHRRSMITDAWWQMHCELHLAHSPDVRIEDSIASSRFYQLIDKYAMWQQLPWVVLFFLMGGWGWVFWGICMRVAVGVSGHWLIGYFAHNSGGRHWHVEGASVQGYDVKFCGLITFGECWHNNHHAFPGSAKMGIFRRQMDPGWWFINLLACFKLVENIVVPEKLPARAELVALTVEG